MSETLEAKSVQHMFHGPSRGKDEPERNAWLDFYIEQGKSNVFTLTVVLTPELARALLARNPSNRNISLVKATEYADDIFSGRWKHNGETIIVAKTGELNDGQHRCRAVQIAGKSIVTEMTFGVERDSRATVDIGIKRTVAQHLGMRGHLNNVPLSLAIATVLTFKKSGRITRAPEARPTPSEIQGWAEAHPEMQDSIVFGRAVYNALRVSAGFFAGLHYIFAEKSRDDADRFFDALASGAGLMKNDPILQLREFLRRERASKRKLPESEIAAKAIKSWNAYRSKRPIEYLKLQKNEDFPTPR